MIEPVEIRCKSELARERVLVYANAGGPAVQRAERQSAVLVADDREVAGELGCCFVEDQGVRSIPRPKVWRLDIRPAPHRIEVHRPS
ncbi:MAG: hypothetical protein PSU94_07230 [Lacunisphaera sp.]|nr:hypothetical protein [Lacunisphaera sp.]